MSAVRYVPYDLVVATNFEVAGDGGGVRDENGIRSALGRVEASFGNAELYPSIEEKAAVLLHGLSSTQYFLDGNKRTAWLVAKLFLGLNGHLLRQMSDIVREAFVLSIATKAFENEDEPGRGVTKAASWFESARLTMRDRYHFAILAERARPSGDDWGSGGFDAMSAMTSGLIVESTPVVHQLSLVTHMLWHPIDANREYDVRVYSEDPHVLAIVTPSSQTATAALGGNLPAVYGWILEDLRTTVAVPPISTHPHHPAGSPFPTLHVFDFTIAARAAGTTRLAVEIDGSLFASMPFSVHVQPDYGDL